VEHQNLSEVGKLASGSCKRPRWLGPGVSGHSPVVKPTLGPLHALRSPSSSPRLETSQPSSDGHLARLLGLVRPGASSLHDRTRGAGPPVIGPLITTVTSAATPFVPLPSQANWIESPAFTLFESFVMVVPAPLIKSMVVACPAVVPRVRAPTELPPFIFRVITAAVLLACTAPTIPMILPAIGAAKVSLPPSLSLRPCHRRRDRRNGKSTHKPFVQIPVVLLSIVSRLSATTPVRAGAFFARFLKRL
jgi:hypothetical protein